MEGWPDPYDMEEPELRNALSEFYVTHGVDDRDLSTATPPLTDDELEWVEWAEDAYDILFGQGKDI